MFARRLLSVSRLARNASTEATVGVVPGIPTPPTRTPKTFMSFSMPDISRRDPLPQAQIPFLPDFWDSSPAKSTEPAEPVLPKLLVVYALDNLPSHNLHDEHATRLEVSTPAPTRPASYGKGGILQDISEDLGLPPVKEIREGVSKLFKSFR
ncbi:hypothetical protein C8J57DRAFT_647603 [Mycena rebaudengoi]|nr:hypothetical protein C8J57DRAFT_647603 [Mycena rebaudengoi]